MVERRRLTPAKVGRPGGDYFPPGKRVKFIPSGCTVLDCTLGGGWPLGRVSNIVGDKAVGKTLLAIEAAANFARYYDGHIWYREAEAAFDVGYAERLGLPVSRVDFGPDGGETAWETVEDIIEDLDRCLAEAARTKRPGLYIIDSLDALSSRTALKRDLDKGTYGLEKPRLMGELFSTKSRRIKSAGVCLMIISQVRDKIGVVFGDRHTRSGGKALDFYASQILYLSHLKTMTRTVQGVKRATGVRVRAKTKKNKLAPPFREVEFTLRFGYGVDDLQASLNWLEEVQMLGRLGIPSSQVESWLKATAGADPEEAADRQRQVDEVVRQVWEEVEDRFLPAQRKYG